MAEEKKAKVNEDLLLWNQEVAICDATELIAKHLSQQGLKRRELAERLGKTKGYITQLLGGSTNMTLRTLSDVMTCLGQQLTVDSHPIDAKQNTVSIGDGIEIAFEIETASVPSCGGEGEELPSLEFVR